MRIIPGESGSCAALGHTYFASWYIVDLFSCRLPVWSHEEIFFFPLANSYDLI